jgi:hypothetical protein
MGRQFLRKCIGFPSFGMHVGYLTFQECLFSLKDMKIFKSPGIDGFTVEFYKFFLNDIKIPHMKCLNIVKGLAYHLLLTYLSNRMQI